LVYNNYSMNPISQIKLEKEDKKIVRQPKFILMLASGILDGLKALWILEADENSKKLQIEASSRVMHKRSTS